MNVHPLVDKALRLVLPYDPSAFVGGGALRDYYFEKPIKDVDIFVGPGFNIAAFEDGTHAERISTGETEAEGAEYAAMFHTDLDGVYEYRLPGIDWPVQIIQMLRPMTPGEHFGRFDWTFCQIAWDGLQMLTSDAFRVDAPRRLAVYTKTPDHWGYMGSVRRAWRFAAKYRDWTFILPDEEPIRWVDRPAAARGNGRSEFFERTLG